MPFTFSHPALILPLSKVPSSKLSITGLITGSLAPDFEYFISLQMRRTHGHDLSSFFWFNLPICFALAFIYHLLVKHPLTKSLPHYFYSRLSQYLHFNWLSYFKKNWFVFIYSAAIGVFSHILWDSFTHDHGLFGNAPSILLNTVPILNIPLYYMLQWISTIIGGCYIIFYIVQMPSNDVIYISVLAKFIFWFNVICIMYFIFTIKHPTTISDFIAVSLGSFLYGIVGSSIYYRVYERIYSNRNITL